MSWDFGMALLEVDAGILLYEYDVLVAEVDSRAIVVF